MIRRLISIAALALAVSVFLTLSFNTQSVVLGQGSEKSAKGEGRKLFLQYCASCHGMEAKGDGTVAASLKTAPSNLTMIGKEDGKFPFNKIQRVISGDDMLSAHGTKEMPVWGTYLRRKVGEGFAKLEIYNLTKYLESIQQ